MIRDKNEGNPVDEETVRIGAGLDEAILSSFTIAAAAEFFQSKSRQFFLKHKNMHNLVKHKCVVPLLSKCYSLLRSGGPQKLVNKTVINTSEFKPYIFLYFVHFIFTTNIQKKHLCGSGR